MSDDESIPADIEDALRALISNETRLDDTLPLYTFFPSAGDGSITVFEAHELADDAAARRRAERVLAAHPTAVEVAIWCDDRFVARHRPAQQSCRA